MTKPPLTPIALACLTTLAHAQMPAERMEASLLEEVIVTATRTELSVFDVPYTAQVLNEEEFIRRKQVRTLTDALADVPGVMVQKTGYGQASPFIRGFTGFRTLAMIDGIRLNNAVFREGPNQYWSTVDQYSVDRLEVVKGPSSVLYGSDAIGGAVNAITRTPPLISWPEANTGKADGKTAKGVVPASQPESGPQVHGSTQYRYATAENSHTVRGEVSAALSSKLGIAAGVTYKDYDDLRGGDLIGKQERSGYSEIDGDFKLLYRPTEDIDVTLRYFRVEQNNAPRWHATNFSKSFDGTEVGTDIRRDFDQLRELAYAKMEARDLNDWISKLGISISFHRQKEEQDRIRLGGRRDIDGFQDDQYGFQLHLETPTGFGKLAYGLEYYRDEVQSWGSRWNPDGSLRNLKPRGPVADDSSYDLFGIYLQDEISVGDKLTITPGVRWTWAQADTGKIDPDLTDGTNLDSFTEAFDSLTFSLRAKYDVTKQWNIFGGVSQGFRAPNLSDFTSFDVARSGEQEIPTTDLDPEQYVAFEIGTKVATEKVDFYASYYYTVIDDQILRYPTGTVVNGLPAVQRTNSGDGYVQGIEAGLNWRFAKGWAAFGTIAWSEGEVGQYLENGIGVFPASRIHPLMGQVGLRWDSSDAKWWAEASVTMARGQDRLSLGDAADTQRIPPGGTHGYTVYTVRAGWRPCERVDIFAACENLTNEDYRIHGSGINEPGTNFVLATKLSF